MAYHAELQHRVAEMTLALDRSSRTSNESRQTGRPVSTRADVAEVDLQRQG
jgi:hypothetical protein